MNEQLLEVKQPSVKTTPRKENFREEVTLTGTRKS